MAATVVVSLEEVYEGAADEKTGSQANQRDAGRENLDVQPRDRQLAVQVDDD